MGNIQRTLAVIVAVILLGSTATAIAGEAELLAVIKSDATPEEKSTALRELSHVATKASVPTLAALLADEKLGHMARYALEPIQDESVDVALRDALGRLSGRPRLGVIGSLGMRRDAKAVAPLAGLLADSDGTTARAAARALGNVGTVEAARAIGDALPKAPEANRSDFCDGLFRCAEALAEAGQATEARAIYDGLRKPSIAPHQIRAAALRGAILSRGNEGIPMLVEAIRGDDYAMTAAAARTAMELPGAQVTAALAAELPKLPADKQILVINTLGYRGDKTAAPALTAIVKSDAPEAVRLAALNNLTHLGDAACLPMLAELSLSDAGELATAARECLTNFPAKDADATVLAMLGGDDPKVRGLAVEMIGQRSMPGAAASLLKAAKDSDVSVRLTAWKALRDQAGQPELPALLDLLVGAGTPEELRAAESTLAALCGRLSVPTGGNVVIVKALYGDLAGDRVADVTKKVAKMVKEGAMSVDATNGNFGDPANGTSKKFRIDYTVNGIPSSQTVAEGKTVTFTAVATPPAVVEAICAAVGGAKGEAKLALLRTLREAGGKEALAAVKAAAAEDDPEVKDTALRVLCDWPTADALPLLEPLVEAAPSKTIKVLALRGLVRLVPQQDAPVAKKVEALKKAMREADRTQEKRLVLGALGNLVSVEALDLAVQQAADAELKEEACLAAVAIAERLGQEQAKEMAAAMKKVAGLTSNEKLAAQARGLAKKAEK